MNSLYAQSIISGKVLSATDGAALPGTYVIEKNSPNNNGVVTDFDGKYKINLENPNNAILIFKTIGFKTTEVSVNGQTVIDIKLEEDLQELDAVVITGYATESKKMSTGSYQTIESDQLQESIQNSFQEGLQGMSPGLDVTNSSGSVGGAVNIRVRGTGSFSSNSSPLYVINGIPFTSYPTDGTGNFGTSYNPMTNINPEDIESVTVLKDAEATAIYGSRGANGVIVVTTKQGKKGKAKWEVNYAQGINRPTKMLEHLRTNDWLNYLQEGWENDGTPLDKRVLPYTTSANNPWYTDEEARQTDIDKYDLAYRQGATMNASVAVAGGTEGMTYRINGTFAKTEGILNANDNERLAFAANFKFDVSDKLKIGINTNISNVENSQYPTNIYFLNVQGQGGGVFQYWNNPTGLNFIRNATPQLPVYNQDGSYFQPTSLNNIVPATNEEYFYHRSNSMTTINSADLSYKISNNLTLDAMVGMTYTGYEREVWYSPFLTTIAIKGQCDECFGYADKIQQARTYINYNAILKYNKEIGDHSFDGLLGFESFGETQKFLSMKGVGFPPTNSIKNVGNAQEIIEWRSGQNGVIFYSGFFRGKYAYKQKYLLGFSARADGSSRFGAKNRWGVFPSASVGWNISEENFLQSSDVLTYLKLRASYGVSGNAEIDQSAAFANWVYNSQSYGNNPGISPLRLTGSTDNIGWERAYSLDIGANFELFNGAVTGEVAYYDKINRDLLAKLDLPPSQGGGQFITNSGAIRNSGVETSLTFNMFQKKAFNWSLTTNVAYLQNEVLELAVDPAVLEQSNGLALPQIGGSVASYQMVKFLGVDPQTGYEMYEDPETGQPYQFEDPAKPTPAEMEGLIQTIDNKTGLPSFTGGITNRFSYKGISFSFMFTFRQGNWIYDDELNLMAYMRSENALTNVPQYMYDQRWQQPGDQTDVPRVVYDHPFGKRDPFQGSRSTRFLYDGSFIRLKNVTLAYTLPKSISSKLRMDMMRFYVTGTNLLTFTKYPGWDPEAMNSLGNFSPTEANIAPGVVKGNPPQAMQLKVGVNLNF
ncbi:SusC/RagA family TonB-linked outer membrane protein [Flammeovirga sp. MY04]|uniref:SusC/RagA family TonB-linked outer membrane protein n=1 Tax=Flammeovirga sp. MY04 TaxID=1191459 RepID=UPI0008260094|nr:SusC/RagA family TonB-linked outer membrane protein [Flammeovirga sp. MY04]ANQ52556.2 SusC/RagA family TonB-linked outer membrane protein [Flammeovirga sp. MY04]